MTAQIFPIDQARDRRLDLTVIDELPTLTGGVEVRFPPAMPEHVQWLMATLGCRVIFDPSVPTPHAWTHAD